jgi:hypothetical protein
MRARDSSAQLPYENDDGCLEKKLHGVHLNEVAGKEREANLALLLIVLFDQRRALVGVLVAGG